MRLARTLTVAAGACALTAAAVVSAGSAVSVPGAKAASVPGAKAPAPEAGVVIRPGVLHAGHPNGAPPTTGYCEANYRIACYEPDQIRQAYNLPALYLRGVNGRDSTIVIVDSFGSPTIRQDLKVFDQTFHYPAPPSLKVIQPAGPGSALRPEQHRHGRLGRGDDPGRRVRAHDCAGREHPAGRDASVGDRGRRRFPADRHGRELRDQPRSRRRDQPELQRDRADLPEQGHPRVAARRLRERVRAPRHRADRVR